MKKKDLRVLVAQLAQLIDDEPSVQWHRAHDKNHELYLKVRKVRDKSNL